MSVDDLILAVERRAWMAVGRSAVAAAFELPALKPDARVTLEALRAELGRASANWHYLDLPGLKRLPEAEPATERAPATTPESEWCCGGTCLRTECEYHKPQAPAADPQYEFTYDAQLDQVAVRVESGTFTGNVVVIETTHSGDSHSEPWEVAAVGRPF